MFKVIRASNGKPIQVDACDFEWLNKKRWYITHQGYARNDSPKNTLMHRLILQTPLGMYSDHVNGRKLDNRRKNLRICTQLINGRNRHKSYGNKTSSPGVRKMPRYGRKHYPWQAYTKINYKFKSLGYFSTRRKAVRARQLFMEELLPCSTK